MAVIGSLSSEGLFVIDVTLGVLGLCFISLHIYGRYCFFGKPFPYVSDIFLVASWVGYLISQVILDYFWIHWGFTDPRVVIKTVGTVTKLPHYELYVEEQYLQVGLKIVWSVMSIYHLQVFLVKMVFLLTYRRLFPKSMTKLRTALNITTVALILGYAMIIGLFLFWCQPIWRNWAKDYNSRCMTTANFTPYFFSLVFHILSDIAIYVLPFFILRKISYNSCLSVGDESSGGRRRLWPVYGVFSLGSICVAIGLARGIIVGRESSGTIVAAFQDAEVVSAQILASLPMTRKVIQRMMGWAQSRQPESPSNSSIIPLSNREANIKVSVEATPSVPN